MALVVMTKAQARQGMLAHLREGKNARYTIRRARFVDDFAVVELTLEYTVDGKKISRAGVAFFEFSGEKISRVAEYWVMWLSSHFSPSCFSIVQIAGGESMQRKPVSL